MKGFFFSKIFKNYKRLSAVCLILLIVSLSACGNGEANSKKAAGKGNSASASEDNDNSGQFDAAEENVDPMSGTISYDIQRSSSKPRDDADEIRYSKNPAGLSSNLVGKYENEANSLRNKILSTANTDEIYKIKGTKYYISPGGNDNNDGKSPERAFRTIEHLGYVDIEQGDAILFERGSIFRIDQSLDLSSGITYGAYGKGDKPKIYASPANYSNAEWKPSKRKNVWKAKFLYSSACSIYFNNAEKIGYLKPSVRNLSENTQFYLDPTESTVYLYCDKGNPSKVYESIEICPDIKIMVVNRYAKNVVIDNLCLRYSGSFGIRADGYNEDITISNCEIGFIGGTNNGNVRLGNAIEAWTSTSGLKIINNYIYQTFDTAITWQGQDSNEGKGISYNNNVISGNLLEYNNADFEFWHTGAEVDSFVIKDNICRFTSLGWGTRADDAGYRGIEGYIYAKTHDMKILNKITVKNNIIDCPGRQIVNWKINPDELSSCYKISGNKFFINESYRTTTEVLREFKNNADDAQMVFATDLDGLKKAIKRFDTTATVKWVKK